VTGAIATFPPVFFPAPETQQENHQ